MSAIKAGIETPCTRVCVLLPHWGLCSGCGRSAKEIGAWIGLSGEERLRIMAQLPLRLQAIAGAPNAPAVE